MVKYSVYLGSFHLWQGLFVTFDDYLPYLSDRSHFMAPAAVDRHLRVPKLFRPSKE